MIYPRLGIACGFPVTLLHCLPYALRGLGDQTVQTMQQVGQNLSVEVLCACPSDSVWNCVIFHWFSIYMEIMLCVVHTDCALKHLPRHESFSFKSQICGSPGIDIKRYSVFAIWSSLSTLNMLLLGLLQYCSWKLKCNCHSTAAWQEGNRGGCKKCGDRSSRVTYQWMQSSLSFFSILAFLDHDFASS